MGKQTKRQDAKQGRPAPNAAWTHEVQLTPEEHHELMSRPLKFDMVEFTHALNAAFAKAKTPRDRSSRAFNQHGRPMPCKENGEADEKAKCEEGPRSR